LSIIKILKMILNYTYYPILVSLGLNDFKEKIKRVTNLTESINFVFTYSYGLKIRGLNLNIRPIQIVDEIKHLMEVIEERNPKVICEIGTAAGGTLFLTTRVAQRDAKIISIDMPFGNYGYGYPPSKIPIYKSFAIENQNLFFIRADSHFSSTISKVEAIIDGLKIDYLFIDGDHSYDGVKTDFDMYSKLVKRGGIIAFHDIVPGLTSKVGGVSKFWGEIKQHYSHKEIVKDWKQGMAGIGILFI